MSLVYAGICCHAPGMTARPQLAPKESKDNLYKAFDEQRQAIEASGAEALVLVSSEHFANFFLNNMPTYSIGMADEYEGPIEDPNWLKIPRTKIPANPDLSLRLIKHVMHRIDVGFAQEWKMDHGMSVPLHFLTPDYQLPVVPVNINCQAPPFTPVSRSWEFGEALREAIDSMPEKIALVGTGGVSHWPCTPDSGKINEAWDQEFMGRIISKSQSELLSSYSDDDKTYSEAGQGALELRTSVCIAAATQDQLGSLRFFEAIPIFATTCIIADMFTL